MSDAVEDDDDDDDNASDNEIADRDDTDDDEDDDDDDDDDDAVESDVEPDSDNDTESEPSAKRRRMVLHFAIFSEREVMFMFAICRRPSVRLSVCLSAVCLSSVTFVHPTQAIEIFRNVSTPFGTLAICDLSIKILRRSSQENPSGEGLNQRGAAKYIDFRTFQGYISETVQDMS